MSDSTKIIINEFSRKFDEPKFSEKLKKYVSGGFNKEIGFSKGKVPLEIAKAISEEQLRINDNYPLEFGKKALIAREISQYSILAVATNGSDDGGRPLACYRYFWLENADTDDFDGVATLLKWWEEKGKPYCEIKPWAEYEEEIEKNGEDFYLATAIYKKYSEQFKQQIKNHQKQTKNNLDANEIVTKPSIFSIYEKGDSILPNYWGLHALALQLNNKYENADIAWSWNTSVMDQASSFTLVCCADKNNQNKLIYYDIQTTKTFCSSYKNLKKRSEKEKKVAKKAVNDTSQYLPYTVLKQEFLKIAKINEQLDKDHIPNLYKSLETGDSTTWDYQQLIDVTSYYRKLDRDQQLYFEIIILLLNPKGVTKQNDSGIIDINIRDFISSIIPRSNQPQPNSRGRISFQKFTDKKLEPVIPQTRIAIITMRKFLYFCHQYLSYESYQRLTRHVYEIINQLLLEIISSSVSKERFQAIEKILVDDSKEKDKPSVYHFKIYLKGYENKLIRWLTEYYNNETNRNLESVQNNKNIDDFCKQVIKDLISYEQQKRNENPSYAPEVTPSLFPTDDQSIESPKKEPEESDLQMHNKTGTTKTQLSQKFSAYQEIAKIFYSAQCYNLAALFYQLKLGYVPQIIYSECSDFVEIIELTPEEIEPEKKNLKTDEKIDNRNSENPINDNNFSGKPDTPNSLPRMIRNFFVFLLLLGIGAGGIFFINRLSFSSSPSFTVDEADPFSEKFEYYRELSQQGYYPRTMTQVNDSLLKDISKINDQNTGIPKLQKFPTDKQAQTAKDLQKAFIEQRKARIKNIGAYPDIASLTPQIDEELSEEILAEMTVAKASADNATVNENVKQLSATIQPVLQSLGFYTIKPLTNTWDQGTSDAIKKFKQHYKLKETGDLDQATWDILYIMIKDKQVRETAIVLEYILKFSQTSSEFEEKVTKLENCKKDPVTYLKCIDKLKNKPAN
ncbi:peptidoglycan-binding domain-containing protein [Crocosphaera sp.]|uniref:peptidoglycan-binding domain-containing protein n=1 Tax=Crocosphaera sp. TaxID=2729996 RepID=UPI0026375910|nr:peptidoglycan-binding domain-containing protein [Crocosphaera sp.]MDJ0579202.1 peptidoglycan-binding domain-containing protein [Crocosphaera sp.]